MPDHYREPEDLLSDESFLSWQRSADGDTGSQKEEWERWMHEDPEHEELVKKAVSLLDITRIPEKHIPEQQMRSAEAALLKKIEETSQPARVIRLRLRWIAAASMIILLTSVSLLLVRKLRTPPELNTHYGEISSTQLPDGTEITLNANSHVKYADNWKAGADREVWLDGEAFFHVTKTPEKSRFIVHTTHLDIIVTGTAFNVVSRHGLDNVMLQEGSVTLHTCDGDTLKMTPGDFFRYDCAHCGKKTVRNDSILAWKEQKLFLDSTSLRQLAGIITDHYGVPVKLATDSLAEKKISGILPNNNLDILLKALEATSEFDISRGPDNSIIIRAHS